MDSRIRVGLLLIGTWLTFFAFVGLVWLAATGYFTLLTGIALVVCFMLGWLFFIPAHRLILERAERMQQSKWLLTFRKVNALPLVASCIATAYVIAWPDQPEQEQRIL